MIMVTKVIDDIDKKIIEALQKEGRKSYTQLAAELHVVEGTVRKRLKRIIGQRIVDIVAVPDLSKLGYGLVSIMGLQVRMSSLREVANKLSHNPNVCYLSFVTGRYDLMAIVITQTPEQLSGFIEKEISAIDSIVRSETFVSLDVIKGRTCGMDTSQLFAQLKSL